jgi:hypothetical protein
MKVIDSVRLSLHGLSVLSGSMYSMSCTRYVKELYNCLVSNATF